MNTVETVNDKLGYPVVLGDLVAYGARGHRGGAKLRIGRVCGFTTDMVLTDFGREDRVYVLIREQNPNRVIHRPWFDIVAVNRG